MPRKIWYLAYGSNMSSEKFTGNRGIVPLDTALVRIPGWTLTMEVPGLPYSEPSFSSIKPREADCDDEATDPDVTGVAYLITEDQYRQVIASEGGGIAYSDICLTGKILDEMTARVPRDITVHTLGTAMKRRPSPLPSQRYMDLLITGGKECHLPLEYQKYLSNIAVYEPSTSAWAKLGALLFLTIWSPVMGNLEKITTRSIGKDGNAQWFIIWLVRGVMHIIWASHDFIFAPVFGRGDGSDQELEE
ncbi:hypothetical protein CC80DRAFT_456340 [Byssothecium circinans]|uniref:gamma-glutamylcyclotransferase n=1 Tax=Byssothecium circinans TaxID=147558 RepID=A0A6A5TDC1_9PLEO|nr:hypothetical protein CC80DRAFT_456340 [Byssothecium circinans]